MNKHLKRLIAATSVMLIFGASQWVMAGKRCTGAADCSACKNCHGCKHCAKDGGTCGVCKPKANFNEFCGQKGL